MNSTRFLPVGLVVLALLGVLCPAGEMLNLTSKTIPLPEGGASLHACELRTDELNFFFIPPATWSQKFKAQENEVGYLSPQNDASIKFVIHWTKKGELVALKSEFLRDYIQTKYTGASILEEFPCYTGSQTGIGFQLEQTTAHAKTALTRLAFVPFPGGWLEFRFSTTADLLAQREPAFNALVSSFRYTLESNSTPDKTAAR